VVHDERAKAFHSLRNRKAIGSVLCTVL
jgi:hypothetical protein